MSAAALAQPRREVMPSYGHTSLFASRTLCVLSLKNMFGSVSVSRVSTLLSVWCVLCACTSTAFARPDPNREYRLGVLQLEEDAAEDAVYDDELASELTTELLGVFTSRSDVIAIDARVTLTQLGLSQGCNITKSNCLQRIATNLRFDGIVFGKLTRQADGQAAQLQRYDARSGSIDKTVTVPLPGPRDHAQVRVDAEHLVTGVLGETHAPPRSAPIPLTIPTPLLAATQHAQGPSARKIAGIGLLGGAAISLGLTVLSIVEINRAENNRNVELYRGNLGRKATMADVCSQSNSGKRYGLSDAGFRDVRRSCGTANVFEVLQYVFLGSAVVTGGVATYLLLGGERKPASQAGQTAKFRLQPQIARGGVGVIAKLRF